MLTLPVGASALIGFEFSNVAYNVDFTIPDPITTPYGPPALGLGCIGDSIYNNQYKSIDGAGNSALQLNGTNTLNITCATSSILTFQLTGENDIRASSNNGTFTASLGVGLQSYAILNFLVILKGGTKLQMDIVNLPIQLAPLNLTSAGIQFPQSPFTSLTIYADPAYSPYVVYKTLAIPVSSITSTKYLSLRFTALSVIPNSTCLIGFQHTTSGDFLDSDNPFTRNWNGGVALIGGLVAGATPYNKLYKSSTSIGGTLIQANELYLNIDMATGSIITFEITPGIGITVRYNNGTASTNINTGLTSSTQLVLLICVQVTNRIKFEIV